MTKSPPVGLCYYCNKDIYPDAKGGDSFLYAMEQKWHQKHFCCAQCGNVLDLNKYRIRGNKV